MAAMIESRLTEINEAGWQVNNLFQIAGGWQANLRNDSNWFTEYGRGATPEDALIDALLKIADATHHEADETVRAYAAPKEKLDISHLLKREPLNDRRD